MRLIQSAEFKGARSAEFGERYIYLVWSSYVRFIQSAAFRGAPSAEFGGALCT